MSRLVLYHGGACADGFTAAWAAWRKWGYEDTTYVPVMYGEPPPDVTDKEVWILDFSYKRDVLQQMFAEAASIRVLDHHKTAREDLAGLPYATFDMNRSGAGITWDTLHPELPLRPREVNQGIRLRMEEPPLGWSEQSWLVDYVEDRDLWNCKLYCSKEVSAYIAATPHTFEDWSRLGEGGIHEAIRGGSGILRYMDRYVESMSKHARMVKLAGAIVPLVNAPGMGISELAGALAHAHPECPFAAGWWQLGNGLYSYSLRSRGDFDVSKVAKFFGGGGHPGAAGFTVPAPVHVDANAPTGSVRKLP